IVVCFPVLLMPCRPLSLHDALPIYRPVSARRSPLPRGGARGLAPMAAAAVPRKRNPAEHWTGVLLFRPGAGVALVLRGPGAADRSESTRLNSSHQIISYAVFCLQKQ